MTADRNKTSNQAAALADAEPTAAPVAAPVWMFILLASLVYWAQIYLDRNAGGFESSVYEPYLSTNQLFAMRPVTAEGAFLAKGRDVYSRTCGLCHQPNGLGTPGVFPPLAQSEWVLAAGPNRLARIVMHGLQGPIKVKGTDWNLAMAALGGALTDEEIAAVLTYIRQEWGNNASAIKTEQVKAVREATSTRTAPWTAAELEAVPES